MVAFQDVDLASPTLLYASFISGILLHLGIFRAGEWDLYTPHLLSGTAVLYGIAIWAVDHFGGDSSITLQQSARIATPPLVSCLGGIFFSILVYRAAFHRLNRFPGPFLARLSNFYVTSLSVKKFHLYEEVQELHAQYGDIVRLGKSPWYLQQTILLLFLLIPVEGPSELSIANPKAYNFIHSNQSPCQKGPWYNILHPVKSLHMIRDRKEHSQRRKTWDKGLGSKGSSSHHRLCLFVCLIGTALRDYEPRVEHYTKQLLSMLRAKEGTPVDASTIFNFYSFDVMGDMAFDNGFDMLKDGVVHYYMESVHANMLAVSAFSHLVWIFPLLKAIPGLNKEHVRFQSWLEDQVSARRKKKIERPDLFSWLLADYEALEKPTKQNLTDLHGDAHLIVVAGR